MASALLAPAICARAPVKRSNAAQALASATLAAPHQLARPGRWPVQTGEELPSLLRSPSSPSSSSSLLGSLRELGEWISPQKHSPAARQPKKGQWTLASAVLAPDSPLGLQVRQQLRPLLSPVQPVTPLEPCTGPDEARGRPQVPSAPCMLKRPPLLPSLPPLPPFRMCLLPWCCARACTELKTTASSRLRWPSSGCSASCLPPHTSAQCSGALPARSSGEGLCASQCRLRLQERDTLPLCACFSLPLTLPPCLSVSLCRRYVVADAGDAIVVAFLGTKRPADHLVNLRLRHSPVFRPFQPGGSLDTAGNGSFAANPTSGSSSGGAAPAAHSGYLARAAAVPAEQLYRLARVQGKRLVLTGHSLGGAVATLCAVRLLDALPQELHHTVSCIGFAVPAVGNAALAEAAGAHGWEQRITNYTLPEDFVPGLMGLFGGQGEPQSPSSQADTSSSSSSAYAAAVAAAAAGGGHGGTIARTDHGKRL